MGKGTLIFDGDCGFCREWVERWRRWTDGSIEAVASRDAAGRFPEITAEDYERAVQYVAADGSISSGAEAVFRSLAEGGGARAPYRLYRGAAAFRVLADAAYVFIAARRPFFLKLTHLLLPKLR